VAGRPKTLAKTRVYKVGYLGFKPQWPMRFINGFRRAGPLVFLKLIIRLVIDFTIIGLKFNNNFKSHVNFERIQIGGLALLDCT
jgi:hypothetical protein